MSYFYPASFKKYFRYLLNPLFLFFERKCPLSENKDSLMDSNTQPRYFDIMYISTIDFIEQENTLEKLSSHEDIVRQSIFLTFTKKHSCPIHKNYEHSVIFITFLFSMMLSISEDLRKSFSKKFSGVIPARTFFLLNAIKLGPIDGNQNFHIAMVALDKGFNKILVHKEYRHDLDVNLFRLEYLKNPSEEGLQAMVDWFLLLEQYAAKTGTFFKTFVPFRHVSLYGNTAQSLLAFFPETLVARDPALFQNSKLTHYYSVLTQALHARLVDNENYSTDFENRWTVMDQATFYQSERDLKKEQLLTYLVDFMINCRSEDVTFFN